MNKTRKIFIRMFLAALFVTFTSELSLSHGNPWKDMGVIKPKIAREVYGFALLDLNNEKVDINSFKSKVVFINFWASWCGPCRKEMPAMEKLYNKYKKKGFVILAINYMEKKEKAKSFIEEMQLTFPALLDLDGSVSKLFKVYALPSSFFIDKKGRIRGVAYGAREWNRHGAMEIVEQLLGEI